MSGFIPTDPNELRDAIASAIAAEEAVEIVDGGSKRCLGWPLQTPHSLDLSRLSGIRDNAPSGSALAAGAATPLLRSRAWWPRLGRCWHSSADPAQQERLTNAPSTPTGS